MAVNLVCSECKSNVSIRAKKCKKCGYSFDRGRKYRVIVKGYDGKRTSRVLDNLNAAKTLEGKLKVQIIERNLFGIVHAPVIDDVWQKYLEWAKENKKSWKDDQDRWNLHIAPHIGGQKMDQVSSYDIDSVIRKMALKKNYAPATIKHVIVLVRRVYNWAMEMDLYSGDNPAKKIKLPKLNNEVTECLDKDQIKSLLKTLDGWRNQPAALLVKFGLFTGLRRGELFKLIWDCIDLENGWIRLKDTKGGKEAKLPISNEAAAILQKAKTLLPHPDCPYVFPSRTGERRTTIGNTWKRIKKSANIPSKFRFHGLRHTYASYLASSGKVTQYTLQKLLTHKSPQMTQRYAHLFDQTLREGANVLTSMI